MQNDKQMQTAKLGINGEKSCRPLYLNKQVFLSIYLCSLLSQPSYYIFACWSCRASQSPWQKKWPHLMTEVCYVPAGLNQWDHSLKGVKLVVLYDLFIYCCFVCSTVATHNNLNVSLYPKSCLCISSYKMVKTLYIFKKHDTKVFFNTPVSNFMHITGLIHIVI